MSFLGCTFRLYGILLPRALLGDSRIRDITVAVFDHIELFYNPIRRHGTNGKVSPDRYEKRFYLAQRTF